MRIDAWRSAMLGLGACLLIANTSAAQDAPNRFDGGATVRTLGFDPAADDTTTEEVFHKRYYGFYGGPAFYRPAFYGGYSVGFYRPPVVSYSFSYYRPAFAYNYYSPYVYRPAYYYSYYPGFYPIGGSLALTPTMTLGVPVQAPVQADEPCVQESTSNLIQRVPKSPTPPAPQPQPPPAAPQQLPQPLPREPQPQAIPPIPQEPPAARTYPYDGGPSNPVPMPQVAPEPLRQPAPVRPMLPTEGRPVSLTNREATAKKYTYPAYGERPAPKDSSLIPVSTKK